MHRTAISQKCKFLPLGKWRFYLKQNMIPHDFFSLSGHFDFLGVTLKSTYHPTRGVNGEAPKKRINGVVGLWRGGRFMSLSLRPHSTNLYAFSKLLYRCNSVLPCIFWTSSFSTKQSKSSFMPTLDLELNQSLELPMTWAIGNLSSHRGSLEE